MNQRFLVSKTSINNKVEGTSNETYIDFLKSTKGIISIQLIKETKN